MDEFYAHKREDGTLLLIFIVIQRAVVSYSAHKKVR